MMQQAKAEIINHYRKIYKRATKREKGRILDIIVESTPMTASMPYTHSMEM